MRSQRGVRHAISSDDAFRPSCSRSAPACCSARRSKEDAASYASGLLIGTDVRTASPTPTDAQIVVMGRPELTRLYAAALREAGREAVELDGEQCFLAGIERDRGDDLT